jgi:hypothetical protein
LEGRDYTPGSLRFLLFRWLLFRWLGLGHEVSCPPLFEAPINSL